LGLRQEQGLRIVLPLGLLGFGVLGGGLFGGLVVHDPALAVRTGGPDRSGAALLSAKTGKAIKIPDCAGARASGEGGIGARNSPGPWGDRGEERGHERLLAGVA